MCSGRQQGPVLNPNCLSTSCAPPTLVQQWVPSLCSCWVKKGKPRKREPEGIFPTSPSNSPISLPPKTYSHHPVQARGPSGAVWQGVSAGPAALDVGTLPLGGRRCPQSGENNQEHCWLWFSSLLSSSFAQPLITQRHNTLGFVRRDTSQWGLEVGAELLRKPHLLWGPCEPHMACVCRATWGQAEGQLRRDPSLWGVCTQSFWPRAVRAQYCLWVETRRRKGDDGGWCSQRELNC